MPNKKELIAQFKAYLMNLENNLSTLEGDDLTETEIRQLGNLTSRLQTIDEAIEGIYWNLCQRMDCFDDSKERWASFGK